MIECVPNFSEGRKTKVVAEIAAACESVADARVLDVHVDADHNRSVVTFVAAKEFVVDAAVRAVGRAAELIDLRKHQGVHPRVGACDVLPFVPLGDATMNDCIAAAHEAGAAIWRELKIPIYFYEQAALQPERKNLANVRRGEFEILREEIMTNPKRKPDVGDAGLHESAGACIIGARDFLVAFNVNLETSDVNAAKRIARRVRERDGGLPCVKALGLFLSKTGRAQVSMNLTNFRVTGIEAAFDAVRREAETLGVEIANSEIVGLAPRAALNAEIARRVLLQNFTPDLILETRIEAAYRSET